MQASAPSSLLFNLSHGPLRLAAWVAPRPRPLNPLKGRGIFVSGGA